MTTGRFVAARQLLFSEVAHDVVEGLLNVNARLGGRFHEGAAELASQRLTLLRRDFSLGHAVALVPDEHDGRVGDQVAAVLRRHGGHGRRGAGGRLLDALNLAVESLDAGEGGARGDAVDEDEAFSVADPLIA